jgi:hypothetical protein
MSSLGLKLCYPWSKKENKQSAEEANKELKDITGKFQIAMEF